MLQWPQVAVFGALPTVGLVAGPSYAGLIFGLGVVLLAHGIVTERRFPVIDRELGLIAVAFAMLCWASAAWSIDPARSLVSALDVTAILAGALVFLGGPPLADKTLERLFGVTVMATLLGAALVVADDVLGYPLQSLISGRPYPVAPTKYNRGIDYLVLIIWPQFAFVAYRGRWRDALSLVACVAVILAIGASLAGQVAALVGMLVLGLAFWLPRAAAPTCTGGMVLLVAGLPFGLRLLAEHRTTLAPFVKSSGTPSTGDLGLHDRARARTPAARLGNRELYSRADNAGRDVSLRGAARSGDISAQPVARTLDRDRCAGRRHRSGLRTAGHAADPAARRAVPAVRLCRLRVRRYRVMRQLRSDDELRGGQRWPPADTFCGARSIAPTPR